jgi:hypothetical protein
MAVFVSGPGWADFTVASKTAVEQKPSVATNTQTGDFLVAYLEEYEDLEGTRNVVALKRFNSQNVQQPIGGSTEVYYPFGLSDEIQAIGRPALAYSPNSNMFFIAFPQRVDTMYGDYDRVFARPLGPDGTSGCCPEWLFDDDNPSYPYQDNEYYTFQGGSGFSSVNVTHNSILNEFLISAQFTEWHIYGDTPMIERYYVLGQRFSVATNSTIGSPIELAYNTPPLGGGFSHHAVAYAPVQNTSPHGGRYLIAGWRPSLFDAAGNLVTRITLNYGLP